MLVDAGQAWRRVVGPFRHASLIFTGARIFTSVMKNEDPVKIEAMLEADALRILRDIPGITGVQVEPLLPDGHRPDAIIRFGDTAETVVVEFKRHANAATAWQLIDYATRIPGARLLLIAGDTTRDARGILERHGVGVVDGLGNAHLQLPGLLVHVEGHGRPRPTAGTPPPARLTGKAGIAAQALLLDPTRKWRVQDLVETAAISAGLAHRVLTRLEGEGLVAVEGAGPRRVRRLINPGRLLDLWAEENRDRRTERLTAFRLAPAPQQLGIDVANALNRAGIAYALTGAYVAAREAPFVTAVPVVDVWVTDRVLLDDAARTLDAEPVATGHNLMLKEVAGDAPLAFRRETDGMWQVNNFRLYYDLRTDPRRGKEQADRLREDVIGL